MNKGIVVVGAGGHAKVCIELLRDTGYEVSWCVGGEDSPDSCLGVPVCRGDDHLVRLRNEGFTHAFVALGANRLRQRLHVYLGELGYERVNAVSPRACVSATAQLGAGVAVMAGAVINAETTIGDATIINTGATIDHDGVIGAAVHIAPQCALAGNVRVGDMAFLGLGTKVIPGCDIGAGAITGAGAVVVSDIDPDVTAVGVPARVIKKHF
ncbi:NeuD/PglB/VioB family sugar acetyltransferase [Luteibacter sp. PPL552]